MTSQYNIVLNRAHHGLADELLLKIYLCLKQETEFDITMVAKERGNHLTDWKIEAYGLDDVNPKKVMVVGVTRNAPKLRIVPPRAYVQGSPTFLQDGRDLIVDIIERVNHTPLNYVFPEDSIALGEWRFGSFSGSIKGLFQVREEPLGLRRSGPVFVRVVDHGTIRRSGYADSIIQLSDDIVWL